MMPLTTHTFKPLNWVDRPINLINRIADRFAELANTDSDYNWHKNGTYGDYGVAYINEHQLLLAQILAEPNRKHFYFLDVGSGDFSNINKLARVIARWDLPKDICVHAIGIGAEIHRGSEEMTVGQCRLYKYGNFAIENILEEFKKRELDLENKIDVIVSRWTIRHLVDPLGTFLQIFRLARKNVGKIISDGFFYHTNALNIGKYDWKMKVRALLLATELPFLYSPYDNDETIGDFILNKGEQQDLPLPFAYADKMEGTEGEDIASGSILHFCLLTTLTATEEATRRSLNGNKNLYDWLKSANAIKQLDELNHDRKWIKVTVPYGGVLQQKQMADLQENKVVYLVKDLEKKDFEDRNQPKRTDGAIVFGPLDSDSKSAHSEIIIGVTNSEFCENMVDEVSTTLSPMEEAPKKLPNKNKVELSDFIYENEIHNPELLKIYGRAIRFFNLMLKYEFCTAEEIEVYIHQYRHKTANEAQEISYDIAGKYGVEGDMYDTDGGEWYLKQKYGCTGKYLQISDLIRKLMLPIYAFKEWYCNEFTVLGGANLTYQNGMRFFAIERCLTDLSNATNILIKEKNLLEINLSDYDKLLRMIQDEIDYIKNFRQLLLIQICRTNNEYVQELYFPELWCEISETLKAYPYLKYNALPYFLTLAYIFLPKVGELLKENYNITISLDRIIQQMYRAQDPFAYPMIFDIFKEEAIKVTASFYLLNDFSNYVAGRTRYRPQGIPAEIQEACEIKMNEIRLIYINKIKIFIEAKIQQAQQSGHEPWALGFLGSRYAILYEGQRVNVPKGMYDIYECVRNSTFEIIKGGRSCVALEEVLRILEQKTTLSPIGNFFRMLCGRRRSEQTQEDYYKIREWVMR